MENLVYYNYPHFTDEKNRGLEAWHESFKVTQLVNAGAGARAPSDGLQPSQPGCMDVKSMHKA